MGSVIYLQTRQKNNSIVFSEVSFADTPVQPQSEVVCKVGQQVNLSISVTNQSLTTLKQLSLNVQFYQDYLNGMQSYNLETRVIMSGSNQ